MLRQQYARKFKLKYLLALLNSTYLRYLYTNIVQELGRVFPQVKLSKLKGLPIKAIPPHQQGPFVKLVEQIMVVTASDDYLDDVRAQEKVQALEQEIDRLVCQLYDLTPEEIQVVEGAAK